jgi:hypothetical protein
METSTGITAGSQDIPHAGTTSTRNGWFKRIVAITVLGLAGALSVTACSISPSPSPTPLTW